MSTYTTTIPAEAPITSRLHLPHVRELDGIRGIAALSVFCHHLLLTTFSHPERVNKVVSSFALVARGLAGVDLFFVLSGFLITSILLLDRGRPHYYWNFYWKRALRIFPLYIVSLICLAAIVPASRPYVVLSALFIANFEAVFHIAGDGPFWTLAIEEQFYIIWPQFAERLTVERLQKLAIGIVAACLLLRLVAASFGHHDFRYTFFHCDGLALGAVLACQRVRRSRAGNDAPLGFSIPAQAGMALFALGVGLLTSFFHFSGHTLTIIEAIQVFAVSFVSYYIVRTAVWYSGAPFLAVLRSRLLTFFGLISYCFYMAHLYMMRIYDHFVGQVESSDTLRLLIRFVLVLAMTVAISLVSRYVVELPAMKLRRHVLRRD